MCIWREIQWIIPWYNLFPAIFIFFITRRLITSIYLIGNSCYGSWHFVEIDINIGSKHAIILLRGRRNCHHWRVEIRVLKNIEIRVLYYYFIYIYTRITHIFETSSYKSTCTGIWGSKKLNFVPCVIFVRRTVYISLWYDNINKIRLV